MAEKERCDHRYQGLRCRLVIQHSGLHVAAGIGGDTSWASGLSDDHAAAAVDKFLGRKEPEGVFVTEEPASPEAPRKATLPLKKALEAAATANASAADIAFERYRVDAKLDLAYRADITAARAHFKAGYTFAFRARASGGGPAERAAHGDMP